MKQREKKKRILTSVLAILLVAALLLTLFAAVFAGVSSAKTLNDQLIDAQNQKKAAEQQLSSIQSQKKAAQADKDRLDAEISSLNGQISTVQAQLDKTTLELQRKEAELAAAELACEQQFTSFKTRARIMYENGPSTYIEILFSSGSFSDFLSNLEIIRNLLDYDNRVLEERRAVREEIAVQKAEVERIKAEQETRRQTLTEMRQTLQTKQQAQAAMISQLATQESAAKSKLEAQQAEEARVQNLINQAVAAEKARAQAAAAAAAAAAASTTKKQPTTTTTQTTGSGSMQWPCPSTRYITSAFGTREHPIQGVTKMHNGIDIGASHGAAIVAADSGTVLFSGNSSSYGKYIVISHGNGITTLYAHCSQLNVSAGTSVSKGQTIALVGSTGNSTGPHLHFEVSVNGSRVNPMNYVH